MFLLCLKLVLVIRIVITSICSIIDVTCLPGTHFESYWSLRHSVIIITLCWQGDPMLMDSLLMDSLCAWGICIPEAWWVFYANVEGSNWGHAYCTYLLFHVHPPLSHCTSPNKHIKTELSRILGWPQRNIKPSMRLFWSQGPFEHRFSWDCIHHSPMKPAWAQPTVHLSFCWFTLTVTSHGILTFGHLLSMFSLF